MNIIQQQDQLKGLPDQHLQRELLQPTGTMPSYLVLSELQRRKSMRDSYAAMQGAPSTSMAEEYAKGMGSADVGQYPQANRDAMAQPQGQPQGQPQAPASSPMGGQQPAMFPQGGPTNQMSARPAQGFADGGGVNSDDDGYDYRTAIAAGLGPDKDGHWPSRDPQTGMLLKGSRHPTFLKGVDADVGLGYRLEKRDGRYYTTPNDGPVNYADGGGVSGEYSPWEGMSYADKIRALSRVRLGEAPSGPYSEPIKETLRERFNRAMSVPSTDMASEGFLAAKRGIQGIPENVPMQRYIEDQTQAAKNFGLGAFTADPGISLGETWSRKLRGLPQAQGDALVQDAPGLPYVPGTMASGVDNTGNQQLEINAGYDSSGAVPPWNTERGPNGTVALNQGVAPTGARPPGPQGVGVPAGGGGAGRRSGVAGALNIGGEGLAQYIEEVRALQAPDRFGEMEARNKEDRDKIAGGMEGERGLALLAAGLGIMGGDSPFAAVNIGRGAQAGIKQWNEASREMRLAERDLRNAENQITVARANRDEKQLETGIKLYAAAEDRKQQALNRANSSGVAAANRAAQLEIAKMDQTSKEKDRVERLEQSRITEAGTLATRYETAANALDMKIATMSANPLAMTDPTAQGEMARLKSQAEALRAQGQQAAAMHQSMVIEREVRAGRLAKPTDQEAYARLPSGTRYVAPDGTLRTKP